MKGKGAGRCQDADNVVGGAVKLKGEEVRVRDAVTDREKAKEAVHSLMRSKVVIPSKACIK